MSNSFGCKCKIKDKTQWVVLHRECNFSHFQKPKGQQHYSEYSLVECLKCGAFGRTKAKYVSKLKDKEGY